MALYDYQPDRNLAVAVAAGFKARIFDFAAEGPRCVYENARGGESVFEPLSDLNASYEAADYIDLWESHFLARFGGRWFVNAWLKEDEWDNLCGPHDTAAEAICEAVLRKRS